ncbi:MAG: hypothetical protein ABI592_15440 [Acidobacteriota bacterium]
MRTPPPSPDPPSPRLRASERPAFPILAVAVWAAVVIGWSYVARDVLPASPRSGWDPEIAKHAPPLARYDSGWYRKIALDGYGPPPAGRASSEHVFFPLYPALTAGLSRVLGVDPFSAGMGLSLAAVAAAAVLFVREARRRAGPAEAGRAALVFLLLFPTSFFFASAYAEAIFLLLSLLAFACVARRSFGLAALCGLLAGLTRLPALALALPLGIAAWQSTADRGRPLSLRRASTVALVALAPVAGVFLWVLGVGFYFGDPGLYFRLQESWNRSASPLAGLSRFGVTLPDRIARGDLARNPAFLIDYADAALFLLLAIHQARRKRWGDASWTAGAVLLPAATGFAPSLPRYLVVVYPAFYALEEIFRGRPRARVLWWFGSALLLLAGVAAFVHWRWVA